MVQPIWETSFFKRDQMSPYLVTFEEACFPDRLYHSLQLQFYVLLMMGAMDARSM